MKEIFDNYDTSGPVDEEKPTFSDLGTFIGYEWVRYGTIFKTYYKNNSWYGTSPLDEEEFEDEEKAEDWDNWEGELNF